MSVARRERLERGLSMNKLARMAGVSVATVKYLEERKYVPDKLTVRKVARALGVSDQVLLADQPFWVPCGSCGGAGKVRVEAAEEAS